MGTTKVQTDQDVEWAVGINRWSLKICGILRDEDYSRCRDLFSNLLAPLYALIILTLGIIPAMLALIKVWGHFGLMVENIIFSLPFSVSLCKIISMWFKREEITEMMHFIAEDWSKLRSENELEVMIKYAQVSRMITFGAYAMIGSSVVTYHLPLLFGGPLRTVTNLTDIGDRVLALQSTYPIDVYQTPIYEITVISQVLGCSIASFCYATIGSLFSLTVLHVCSQLENLKISIECMVKEHKKSSIISKNFQRVLISNVREHQRLIRFSNMIENTFSIMLLMITPAFMIVCCVQVFMIVSIFEGDDDIPAFQLIFCVVFTLFIILVMFAYTSVGEVLVTQSTEIQHAAYNCEWYNLEPTEADQLIMLLVRAQRPLTITAGTFVPLTLSTFANIMKTSLGYLSCLLAVQN